MKICRFRSGQDIAFGVQKDDLLYDLSSGGDPRFRDLQAAYASAGRDARRMVALLEEEMRLAPTTRFSEDLLLIPLQVTEVWAAGVTYLKSREARETETKSKGVYDYIYGARRPELFLKDTGIRCRGPGEDICIRSDSEWSVPEPELTVVFDEEAKVVAYTVGNDVSSRDIEGENPLYLPQAKVYLGSSSVGPVIVTPDEVTSPDALQITMKIVRAGRLEFEGSVNTSQMKRSISELAGYLRKDNVLPRFTLLMTGTSIVPPDEFTLMDRDTVEVEIEGIGVLRNNVVKLH